MPTRKPRKQKTGTRKSTILQRHQRQTKNARLIAGLKRFGISTGLIIFVVWAGAWIILSGSIGRGQELLTKTVQQKAAAQGFIVSDVLIEGRRNADPDVILGLLDVRRGDSILAFDPVRAREDLMKMPWVSDARIERRLPGVVYVSIHERQPFALWQSQGKLRLIDPDGVTISDIETEMAKFRHLPLVVGDGAQTQAGALFDLIGAEPLVTERLEAAVYVGHRRWDLKMKNATEIRLPEGDISLALRRLGDAQERDGLLDKNVQSIDLREPGRIIVQTKPGAVQDYKASLVSVTKGDI